MAVGEGVAAHSIAAPRTIHSRSTVLSAYFALTKPRIMSLLLFTTLAAFLIALRQHPLSALTAVRLVVGTLIGGALASGGAAALNCYIDRDIDDVMARTRRRAIPAGIVAPHRVLVFGLGLSALSLIVLFSLTNIAATLLALAGNLFYVVVYTLWLKRATTQNIVIGGAAGAIPPLVGWAAVTGSLALPALLLFVIITYWTPAHFWSLALLVRRDYSRARVPMLPSVASEAHAHWQILVYTLLVVIASLLLFAVHAMGLVYLIAAILLGAGFLYQALLLRSRSSARQARRTFMYSNLYLAALFGSMIIDRLAG
jgi:protoheme IX farnesyltransferase